VEKKKGGGRKRKNGQEQRKKPEVTIKKKKGDSNKKKKKPAILMSFLLGGGRAKIFLGGGVFERGEQRKLGPQRGKGGHREKVCRRKKNYVRKNMPQQIDTLQTGGVNRRKKMSSKFEKEGKNGVVGKGKKRVQKKRRGVL